MSTARKTTTPSLEVAVEEALRRMAAAWRAHSWTPDEKAEYRKALAWVGDASVVEAATDAAIRETVERHPPPIGALMASARAIKARRPGADAWQRKADQVRWIEAAPDHRDPPGTVRWIAVYPDGTRYPPRARAAGE